MMGPEPHTAQSTIIRDNPRKFMALAVAIAFGGVAEPLALVVAVVLFFCSFLAWLDYRRWDAITLAKCEREHREEQMRRRDMRVRY